MPTSKQAKHSLRFPRIYTIHSSKGGVGKTSIALAVAGFTAIYHEMKTIIIDADLTGASLADVFNWGTDPIKWHYFNDLILAQPYEFSKYTSLSSLPKEKISSNGLNSFYRTVPDCGALSIMPSSPRYQDIARIIPLISQEDSLHFFRHRMEDVIIRAFKEGFESIIIDHPPGLYGVSLASLRMVFNQIVSRKDFLENTEHHTPTRLDHLSVTRNQNNFPVTAEAILITTQDPADYKAIFPNLSAILDINDKQMLNALMDLKEGINILLNKAQESSQGRFDSMFEYNKILRSLTFPDVDGRKVHKNVSMYLKTRGEKVGVTACKAIGDFDCSRILSTIQALKSKGFHSSEIGMESWCLDIARSVGLFSDSLAFE